MGDTRELRFPESRETAQTFVYGDQTPYRPEQCAAESTTTFYARQCRRRPGHGPSGMFCRQHGLVVTLLTAETPERPRP